MDVEHFIAKYKASGGRETATFQPFVIDLCDTLGVARPDPTQPDDACNLYVFERAIETRLANGKRSTLKADLFKHGCFIMEAKQGVDVSVPSTARHQGIGKRESPRWHAEMHFAKGQALGYARSIGSAPPFVIVCDVGYCFELYACFDGSGIYSDFESTLTKRIYLDDLRDPAVRERLRRVFDEPKSLDPRLRAVKVTQEVAEHLARLAKDLEHDKHPPKVVARFLMRCLFTMFAEDVGLLPPRLFTDAIRDDWVPNPAGFTVQVEALWRAMNDGGSMFRVGKLLKFNGGLFTDPSAIALNKKQLEWLLEAAECDWSAVEPAIFGTLLERALDPSERHALGAHFTPRMYVERLVRPTVEEPLRDDWDTVRAEALEITRRADASTDPSAGMTMEELKSLSRAERKKLDDRVAKWRKSIEAAAEEARDLVRGFHKKLTETKILDPACGSGNFLYVTLDVLMRLESEVVAFLADLGEPQEKLEIDRVTPRQFLGIEKNTRAKEIAELVLWIGYLQWHYRTHGRTKPPPEPVLRDYKNIEERDAVLAWDRTELEVDEAGKPKSRWDGESFKRSPVTGDKVPNEEARVPIYRYVNPRKAEWPKADFIVGNPPFVGNPHMKTVLGEGYVTALRRAHGDVPESVDFVMYWWNRGAVLAAARKIRGFGFITTNSITQPRNRAVIENHRTSIALDFAIPDHPWVDSKDGAAVRIAMTSASPGQHEGVLARVVNERASDVVWSLTLQERLGLIRSDLSLGADLPATKPLRANDRICSPGVKLHGPGFIVTPAEAKALGLGRLAGLDRYIREYRHGKDVAQIPRRVMVIDLHGLAIEDVRGRYPEVYQRLLERVKPGRDQNNEAYRRENWWLFGRKNTELRAALKGLARYIATPETAKQRFFVFLSTAVVPDNMLVNIGSDDAYLLGLLSSHVHIVWTLRAGGTLEDRPRYTKSRCFDPFPFPAPTEPQKTRIRALGESLDAHRKRQQQLHPTLTLTGMYNVLEKLRSGEALTEKERVIHEQGLVSVLKQIHDDLDAAVFEAYGWPTTLTDEEILEKLVKLNAERAEEEKRGLVRWLRPEFQNPEGKPAATQVAMEAVEEADEEEAREEAAPAKAAAWPKKLADQITAVRDVVVRGATGRTWTTDEVTAVFKGSKRAEVRGVLESLAALGHVVRVKVGGVASWQVPVRGAVPVA